MKKVAFLFALLLFALPVSGQVPQIINYQGRMTVGGVNFNGNGQFKFALVNGAGTVLWSNSPIVSGQPGAFVVLPVTNGIYSVFLGDTTLANMAAVPSSVFGGADVRLRIWFNNGAIGFQQLSPDQRIGAVGYAIMADGVKDGAITSSKLAAGAVTSAAIAGGAVTSTALANGAVTSSAIANGAVGSGQLAAGAVTGTSIADGAITAAKIGNGAITASQIADNSISTAKLSKQYDGGLVSIYNYDMTDFPSSKEVTIPFSATFGAPPIVSFGAEGSNPTFLDTLKVTLKSKTASNFNLLLSNLAKTDTEILSVTAAQVSSRGVVSSSVTSTDLIMLSGGPAVAYVESGRLYYRRALDAVGNSWATALLLDTVDAGTVVDVYYQNGNPAIAYSTGAGAVRFVRATDANGAAWGAIGTAIGSGVSSRAVGGSSGALPAIVVYDFTNSRLQFCRATNAAGTTWAAPVALPATNGMRAQHWDFSMVNGQPAVTYSVANSSADSDLWFLRSTTDGTTWPATGNAIVQDAAYTRQIGKNPRFLTINGNPAIAYATDGYYYDTAQGRSTHACAVCCIRAADNSGSSWASPVALKESDVSFGALAPTFQPIGDVLTVGQVNGIPHVLFSCRDVFDALCDYSASDVNATAWERSSKIAVWQQKLPDSHVESLNNVALWTTHASNEVALVHPVDDDFLETQELPAPELAARQSNGALGATVLPSGKPLLAFFDPGDKTLKVSAAADTAGTSWTAPVTIGATSGGIYLSAYEDAYAQNNGALLYTGRYGSARIQVTPNGQVSLGSVQALPAIAYTTGVNRTLNIIKATSYDGLTWGLPFTVHSGTGTSISDEDVQLLNANGNPAIIFRQDTSVKIARATNAAGTAWGAPTTIVTDANLQWGFRAALIGGNPSVVYGSAIPGAYTLKFLRASDSSGATWPAPTAVSTASGFAAGTFHSLALAEISGTPAIAFHYTMNGKLLYYRSSVVTGASGWSGALELDSAVGTDQSARARTLELISGDKPVVLYEAQDALEEADLRSVAANDATGGSWSPPKTILSAGNVGLYVTASMSQGTVYAACNDFTRGLTVQLKSTTGGQTWEVANQGHEFPAGEHFCVTMAGGNPMVFFQMDDSLYKCRANDPEGSSWPFPTMIQGRFTPVINGEGAGYFPSAAVIGGRMCVTFYDADYDNLWFKRANDAAGNGFATAVNIVSTNDVGGYSSLLEVNGRPAVSYYNFTNKTLHYSRALDAAGNDWAGANLTVVGTAGNGEYCQLTLLGGNPAILYYDANGRQLMLVRALDVNGATWGTPQVVDDGKSVATGSSGVQSETKADVGRFAKLAIMNGIPCVTYTDSTNKDLLYKRANDASGTTWGARKILASNDDTGLFPTIVAVGNIPSVFHFDRARKSIRNILPTLPFSVGWTAVAQ